MASDQDITMDTVHASMPFPEIMKCHDEPTYQKMAVIWKMIHQNY